MNEEQMREVIRDELRNWLGNERFIFQKPIQILDARNIQVGKTNGTKIGTAANQKLSVYGVTPVEQQAAITLGGTAGVAGYDDNARIAIQSLIDTLKNFGITA